MRIGLWVYIAAFVGICVASLADPELRGTRGEMILDLVLSVVALTGLVAYALRVDAQRMIAAWRFVAPALLVGYIVQLFVEWPSLVAHDPEMTRAEHQGILVITLIVSTLFLAPAIVVNFRFARARHLQTTAAV